MVMGSSKQWTSKPEFRGPFFSNGLETPSPLPTMSEYLAIPSPSLSHHVSPPSEHSDLGLPQNPASAIR